jgi:putative cell wall-binding protein
MAKNIRLSMRAVKVSRTPADNDREGPLKDTAPQRKSDIVRMTSAALSVGLLPALLALPAITPPAPEAKPVAPEIQTISLASLGSVETARAASADNAEQVKPAVSPDGREVTLIDHDTEDFQLVGVTWDTNADTDVGGLTVKVRVRSNDTWSPWEVLEPMDEGPDETSAEGQANAVRTGTSPLVTDEANGVEVKVATADGALPSGLRLDLIDPGESAADNQLQPAQPASSAEAAASKPTIITRAQWGADERLRGTPRYNGTIKAGVMHHTAGSNSYTASGAAAQVRGYYAYHTQTLGWSDIGYNFLVDKYGRIYEGRAGGVDKPVKGAHAGGFNTDTFGVSAMGNYETAGAPAVMLDSMARVMAWKLSLHGRNPLGKTWLQSEGGGTSKYAKGVWVEADVVGAHRDYGNTSCPGRNIVSQESSIRSLVNKYAANNNVARVSGGTKFDTSVAIGEQTFPSSKTVVIVSADEGRRADGAVAAPFAYRKGAPVLLSSGGGLSDAVIADIKRRGVTTAYLVGGHLALSSKVESQLRAVGVGSITRFAGDTRYDTAAKVARAMGHQPWAAFVASGDDRHLIDALAAGGIGARNGWPVLLTRRDSVPAETQSALRDLKVSNTFAVGGSIPITDRVVNALPNAKRISGSTLYDTAAALASNFVNVGTDRVVIASGDRYNIIDALAGGTYGHLILLTHRDDLTPVTERWLKDKNVDKAVVVGGPLAVSDQTVQDVAEALLP